MREDLAYRVGGFLKPVWTFRGLLGGHHLDEPSRKRRKAIGLSQVAIQGGRVVLRQHEHLEDIRVDAVGYRDINETIFSAKRHRGFRALLSERKQAGSRTTTKNYREQIMLRRHDSHRLQEMVFARENRRKASLVSRPCVFAKGFCTVQLPLIRCHEVSTTSR